MHLLADRMQEVPEHQPTPVRLRIGYRDEGHVVPDTTLDPEGMSQREISAVRLYRSMVFGTLLRLPLAPRAAATQGLHMIVIHGCAGEKYELQWQGFVPPVYTGTLAYVIEWGVASGLPK